MRKLTAKELREQVDSMSLRLTLHRQALNDLINNIAPDASVYHDDHYGRYTLRLFRCTSPHGGYVVRTYTTDGQEASTVICLLDDYMRGLHDLSPINEYEWDERRAWNELKEARRKMFQEEIGQSRQSGG